MTSSDRDIAGLRGPVRSVTEERTYPAWTDAEGKARPAAEQWNKTEYDREGRLAVTWWRAPSGEGRANALTAIRYTYKDGRMLTRTAETDSKLMSQTTYDYDDTGRLKSITCSSDPTNPIAFQYDANGRKTKIAIRKPADTQQGTSAISTSFEHLFDDEGSTYTNSSEGGSATTLYDELNRPIEMQFHDAEGTVTSRAIRIYDSQGRVSEEKMLMTDPIAMLSAGNQKAILEAGNVQELRDQFAAFLGGPEMWLVKYEYDDRGRKVRTTHNTFNHIHETTRTKYNQQGDVQSETTHYEASGNGSPEADENRSGETIYTYEYDSQGNWLSRAIASRDLPNGLQKSVGDEVKRTIEYY
ncbi:hypothetical protein [Occallatibacter savannae]|uniref:hypothetical protein n=1 Tax=Occallatibacter savannae TaxID=1002691 RepID=UPI000D68B81B|nr:hypothetical protein [Occallatibacter savannae]